MEPNTSSSYANCSVPSFTAINWDAQTALLAGALTVLNILTVTGNVFVMLAICMQPQLRRVQYALIFTLALADLIVGLVVMPIAIVYQLQVDWQFGELICELWLLIDVCVCTASILHLVAIALDRYCSVTNVAYISNHALRTRTILIMLAGIWSLSLLVSAAPWLGWRNDDQFSRRIQHNCECLVSQTISYQVVSTMTAFYIPLCFLCVLYWRLHGVAKQRIKAINQKRIGRNLLQAAMLMPIKGMQQADTAHSTLADSNPQLSVHTVHGLPSTTTMPLLHMSTWVAAPSVDDSTPTTTAAPTSATPPAAAHPALEPTQSVPLRNCHNVRWSSIKHRRSVKDPRRPPAIGTRSLLLNRQPSFGQRLHLVVRQRLMRQAKRTHEQQLTDSKAWRTVAIITGSFVACWLPFFLLAIARPFIARPINPWLTSVSVWLGYANSTINPIIYTVFSPDFRQAFRSLLPARCSRRKQTRAFLR